MPDNLKMLKSPLRYPGGKTRATKFLFSEQNLPKTINSYREPFLGGGSCAIAFTKMFPDTPVWVNDKYENLYFFWAELQKNGERLYKRIVDFKDKAESYEDVDGAHRELFNESRVLLSDDIDSFERAARFFVVNKCSFSGLGESSGFSASASKSNFSRSVIGRIPQYSDLIKNWLITNYDYDQVINEDVHPDDFIFLDPPYDINSFLYGKKGKLHEEFDHYEFYDKVANSSANVMITYNSNEIFQEMYADWILTEWDLTYTMHSGTIYRNDEGNRKELLIRNYEH